MPITRVVGSAHRSRVAQEAAFQQLRFHSEATDNKSRLPSRQYAAQCLRVDVNYLAGMFHDFGRHRRKNDPLFKQADYVADALVKAIAC